MFISHPPISFRELITVTNRCTSRIDEVWVHVNNLGVTGVRELGSSTSCTSHSSPPLLKLSWLKGLTSFLHLSEHIHSYHHRTYAITWKSKWVAGILYIIAALEFGVGFYMFISSAENPGQCLYNIKGTLKFLKDKSFGSYDAYDSSGFVSRVSSER